MEDNFYINLADCVVGPEEIDLLLKEWLKDPQPKTVPELARAYLTNRIEDEKGYLPYDRRRYYKEDDKIIIYADENVHPAQIIKVIKDYNRDSKGFSYDAIDLVFLDRTAALSHLETRSFLVNYQGEELAGSGVRSFEIIKEKDEAEVIPKILAAISNDKRFVAFEDKWLPMQLLTDVSDKLSCIEKIIEEYEHALSAGEILEKLQIGDNEENLNACLEFSLNDFLSKDRKFVQVPDSVTKWDLRKRHEPTEGPIPPEKKEWTVTIKLEWLEKGILIVPRKLATYMEGTNTVHILYDRVNDVLPYEENDRLIEGFNTFYSAKAIAEGDRVHLRLQALEPTRLFIHSSWKVSLNKLLQIEPKDLDWENSSLRDCIIVVLGKFGIAAHYREIYSEVAIHKHVSIGSIIGTLSRYCPRVFVHVGSGQWQLAGWTKGEETPESEPTKTPSLTAVGNEIWDAVQFIEENDYVYKLLQRIRKPLSFDEICSKLANYLRVDTQELRATGFLKANDERFRRLDDGTWVLEEWFKPEEPVKVEDEGTKVKETRPKKTSKSVRFWLVLTVLLTLLLVGILAILIW